MFQNTKIKLQQTKQELDDLRWANEALELRFETVRIKPDRIISSLIKTCVSAARRKERIAAEIRASHSGSAAKE